MLCLYINNHVWDFPSGPVVWNLPCKAGDMGSIPGWGTINKITHAKGQLLPCAQGKIPYAKTKFQHRK